jgi:Uncharacterized conserved protein, COG1434
MFFLKKLIAYFILPPGLLVITFALLGILTKRKLAKLIAFSFALFVYLLSIEPIKDVLYKPLEEAYPVPSKPEGDAIVILGGGSYSTGILKEDSTKRLLMGFVLHKQTNLPIILSGGASIGALPEAEIMKGLLLTLGVDKGKIHTDVNSKDTEENAQEVKKLCERLGCKKIILVSSAYHIKGRCLPFKGRAWRWFHTLPILRGI